MNIIATVSLQRVLQCFFIFIFLFEQHRESAPAQVHSPNAHNGPGPGWGPHLGARNSIWVSQLGRSICHRAPYNSIVSYFTSCLQIRDASKIKRNKVSEIQFQEHRNSSAKAASGETSIVSSWVLLCPCPWSSLSSLEIFEKFRIGRFPLG